MSLRTQLPVLADRRIVSNAALELARYLDTGSKAASERCNELLVRVAQSTAPDLYVKAFARWKALHHTAGSVTADVQIVGRLIVGLSSESVIESSIAAHPVYGLPMIPGRALKGLARHYFRAMSAPGTGTDEHARVLFGDQGAGPKGASNAAGYISYFDAWWIPTEGASPFALDVLTTHHPAYYVSSPDKRRAPTDFDDPNPNAFLSAQGAFLIAVRGPSTDWSELAMEIVLRAMFEWGSGGKTSSGYGRIESIPPSQTELKLKTLASYDSRIVRINGASDVSQVEPILEGAKSDGVLPAVADRIKAQLMAKGLWTNKTIDKQWRRAVEEALQ